MKEMVTIKADVVKAIRIRKGWTATDLAKHCGFAQGTRTAISRGGPISISTLRRLAEALGVKVATLLQDPSPENSVTQTVIAAEI